MISFNNKSIQKIIILVKFILINLKFQGFEDKNYIYN